MTPEQKAAEYTPLQLAVLFHDTYESLAPSFGYETRAETRTFDATTPNGRLMVAVCERILKTLADHPADEGSPVTLEDVAAALSGVVERRSDGWRVYFARWVTVRTRADLARLQRVLENESEPSHGQA